MSKSKQPVGRRGFLKGAAAGAAGLVAAPIAMAQQAGQPAPAEGRGAVEVTGNEKPGSDFMVDVIKTLGIEYCAANPGIELPRPPGILHQLRRQQEPGVAHLLPRRVLGGHGPRLRQDRRQAHDDHGARQPSACSTRRWRSTTATPIACRCTSFSATFST